VRALFRQVPDAGFTHFARADDHDGPGRKIFVENALGQFNGDAADGSCTTADGGLCANFFGDLEGALEEAISDATGQFGILGSLIGLFDLASDFGLAEDHGIESAGD